MREFLGKLLRKIGDKLVDTWRILKENKIEGKLGAQRGKVRSGIVSGDIWELKGMWVYIGGKFMIFDEDLEN